MISLNYRDSSPIYEQIKNGIKKMVITGMLQEGDRLPSVRALATELAINPNTIQKAYNELENEGCIYSIPGKGSFSTGTVRADAAQKEKIKKQIRALLEELRFLGADKEELLALLNEEEQAHD